jgi:hypothetical protein
MLWSFALPGIAGKRPAGVEEFIIDQEEKYLGNT